MVEAHYTLTLDDYREANGIVVDPAKRRARRWQLAGGVIALILLAAAIVILTVLAPGSRAAPGPEPFPLARLALTMAPAMALCLLFATIFFLIAKNPSPKPWLVPLPGAEKPPAARLIGGASGWIAFVAMAVMLFLMLRASSIARQPAVTPRPPETRLPWLFDFALPLVPILFLLLVFGIFATWSARRRIQTMWSAMRHEQRPRTIRADEASLTVEQEDMTSRYNWSFFAGYKETANLLVLYLSPFSFHMVPKRAFATPADLDAFKGLLMNGVAEGTFLPAGQTAFPVVPIAKVAASAGET
jgi:hypothetical protein